jgi:hypothetical protein
MDPMQVIEELGVPGRLPVEAIRAARQIARRWFPYSCGRSMISWSCEGRSIPTRCSSFFICSANGVKNRHAGRWQDSWRSMHTTNCFACVFAMGSIFKAGA